MRNVKSTSSKVGDWCFVLLCVIISAVCLLPMIHLLAKSLSGTDYLVRHEVSLCPDLRVHSGYLCYCVCGELNCRRHRRADRHGEEGAEDPHGTECREDDQGGNQQ